MRRAGDHQLPAGRVRLDPALCAVTLDVLQRVARMQRSEIRRGPPGFHFVSSGLRRLTVPVTVGTRATRLRFDGVWRRVDE